MLCKCGNILLEQSYMGKTTVKAIKNGRYKPVIWKGISRGIQKVYAEKAAAIIKENNHTLTLDTNTIGL